MAKTVDGQTTEFLWQGDRLIAESGADPKAHYRSYLYEPGTFRPLVLLSGEGCTAQAYYYQLDQLDHLGTPQDLTDAHGNIRWSADYTAYGSLAHLRIADIDNPLRFQGQYFDAETGLHYNRHRYYTPHFGRYLTSDPIKLAGGLNSYLYVPNPTGWVDPLGLSGNCPGAKGCKPDGQPPGDVSGARVDAGEPEVPKSEVGGAYLYRGDSRPHHLIFEKGFKSKGDSDDLELHAFDNNNPPSNFISTSTSSRVAVDFATAYGTRKGNLYTLRSVKGWNVNVELGSKSPFPDEFEIAVSDKISPDDILGVTPLKSDGSYIGHSIPNPKRK